MKRVAAWAFVLVLILALSGCGSHTQNGQGTPSNSAEHVDKASQVPKDHHLGGLTSDREKNHDFISDFSYEEVRSTYEEDDPGVKHSGFHNTSSVALETIQDVLDQAKKECTISYDTVDVSYDGTTSIWQTVFYTEGMVGGSQTVYMDSYGVTCLVVYGE